MLPTTRRQQGVSVYREQEKAFSVKDRIQFTAPANGLKIANRELGTVESITDDGRMNLEMDGGRRVSIDPKEHPHLDHGYAVTSHASQGQTADRVLIHVDTELAAKDLLNHRMAYVAVSRGAHDAQIFTSDREQLAHVLSRDVSHQSAHVPEIAQAPEREIDLQPAVKVVEHEHHKERGMGQAEICGGTSLFRAVDKYGRLIDFMLADRRNTRAAHRFLGKALTTMRHWPPSSITTDQLGSYPKAIHRLQREGKLADETKHRTCKYLNNIIEADHGALKRVIRPTRGFQTMKTAAATIKGFEVMRMIRRGHCLTCKPHVKDEVRFVNKLFGIFAVAA